jgi:prepilin-type N-terminal cleavage/methylation domain-containing protein/prepilin-type processing-associated H-X9-DG protein
MNVRTTRAAFTLIELLVVIAIIALLAALVVPGLVRSREAARASRCSGQLRQIAMAVSLYADSREDRFPRSQHSAAANNEKTWGRALAPLLGANDDTWLQLLRGVYHCPSDSRTPTWSYGLNVYFELGPEDDYDGKPDTWRRRADVPNPAATVLFAENASTADHIMPNFWAGSQDAEDCDSKRHRGKANYAYVDGHIELLPLETIYDTARGIDRWNPAKAK